MIGTSMKDDGFPYVCTYWDGSNNGLSDFLVTYSYINKWCE